MRVCPSVRRPVRPSVRSSHTSWIHAKMPFLTKTTISTSEDGLVYMIFLLRFSSKMVKRNPSSTTTRQPWATSSIPSKRSSASSAWNTLPSVFRTSKPLHAVAEAPCPSPRDWPNSPPDPKHRISGTAIMECPNVFCRGSRIIINVKKSINLTKICFSSANTDAFFD